MKVQQASRQEISLLRDVTAATEGAILSMQQQPHSINKVPRSGEQATQTWRIPHKSGSWIA